MGEGDMAGKAAGWYQDPRGERSQRYWDGLAWTSFARGESGAAAAQADTGLYQPRRSSALPAAGWTTPGVRAVAGGQKLAIYAIALNIVTYVVAFFVAFGLIVANGGELTPGNEVIFYDIGRVVGFALWALLLVGVYRLTAGLGYSMAVRVLCLVLMLPPLFNLIVLLVLNRRAIRFLRGAGLRVGFFGVR